jgi:NitT/TauT family transport system permease protein
MSAVMDDAALLAARERGAARARRARHAALAKTVLLPIATAAAFLLGWEWFVRAYAVPAVILPPPSEVLATLIRLWPLLAQHAVPTTTEAVAGFALATLFGVTLATALVASSWIRAALYPNVVFFQLIPKIALAPLFIVWLGIGTESRLAFSLFISFFPVVIATATGLTNVPADMVRLCRSLTASDWQVFASVRFPYALPYIFSGMKIAITFAIIGVVVGEFITAQAGLGYLILFASSKAETGLILAAITVLCGVGLALFALVALAERLVLRRYGPQAGR